MEFTLYKKTKKFIKISSACLMLESLLVVCYLAGRTFLNSANYHLFGQADQDIGAVIVQSHVVAIKGDYTQV